MPALFIMFGITLIIICGHEQLPQGRPVVDGAVELSLRHQRLLGEGKGGLAGRVDEHD